MYNIISARTVQRHLEIIEYCQAIQALTNCSYQKALELVISAIEARNIVTIKGNDELDKILRDMSQNQYSEKDIDEMIEKYKARKM